MSRIGKKPIPIPSGVTVVIEGRVVKVKGPKGEISQRMPEGVSVQKQDSEILVSLQPEFMRMKALHGLARALCNNMVQGVTGGFSKDLEIQGVGYRAKLDGKKLILSLGFTHPVEYPLPEGLKIDVEEQVRLKVSGVDKQLVGEAAAQIRRYLPPEPYKGKGIRYAGELVRKKAGKTVA